MSEGERFYFQIRAEEEIKAAQSAVHPDAARAHYMMAGYYLDLAHNPEAWATVSKELGGGNRETRGRDKSRVGGLAQRPALA